MTLQAEEARLQEMAQRGQAVWMLDAQKGLQVLLRAKMGPSHRQAVLLLVAYLSRLSSPAWLLVSRCAHKCYWLVLYVTERVLDPFVTVNLFNTL